MGKWLLLLSLCFAYALGAFSASNYNSSAQLSPSYTIYWNIAQTQIELALVVKTTGWIGFGIGEPTSGGMAGADIVTALLDDSGTLVVTDRYALEMATPSIDHCNDWVGVSSQKTSNGNFIVELSRALNTQDQQDRAIVSGPNNIIWAFGTSNVVTYHEANRGTQTLVFYGSSPQLPNDPQIFSQTYQLNQVSIPIKPTSFMCTTFAAPNSASDLHLIEFAANINNTSTDDVFVYGCVSNSTWVYSHLKNPQECYTTSDQVPTECQQLLWVWTHGMGPFILPSVAGFRVSGTTGFQYFAIRTHYDNPTSYSNVDSSSFTFTFTSNLRANDAGVLQIGDPYYTASPIPALTSLSAYEFSCSAACTSQWPYDIIVFGDFFFMHSLGSRVYSTHSSATQYVGFLNDADFYDHDFPHLTPVNAVIQRGDRVNTHCFYNTADSLNATPFGLAATSETCIEFLFYYPKMNNMDVCGASGVETVACGPYSSPKTITGQAIVLDGVLPVQFGTASTCPNQMESSSAQVVQGAAGVGAMVGVVIFAIVIIVAMNAGLLLIALKSKGTEPRHNRLADQEEPHEAHEQH